VTDRDDSNSQGLFVPESERDRFARAEAQQAAPVKSRKLLQGFQADIERLAKEDAERRRLAAILAEQRQRERAPKPKPSSAPASQQAQINKAWLEEQISISVAKRRASQQRKNGRDEGPIGPTPERRAKDVSTWEDKHPPIPQKGVPARTNVGRHYQSMSPVDRYEKNLSGDMEAVAREIMHLFLLADAGQRMTASYDGSPGGVFGPRPGGVQDYIREAHATARAIESDLGPAVMDDIRWFITQQVIKPDGSSMKLSDSGRKMSPWKPNEEKDTAVGYGGLYRSLQILARYMAMRRARGWHVPHVAIGEAGRQQTLALVNEINSRARKRQERSEDGYTSRVLARYLSLTRRLGWRDLTAEEQQLFVTTTRAKLQERRERTAREDEKKRYRVHKR
jgi:hypothetical protein